MRIISGSLRGRKLEAPRGWDIRPTTDRVREAIFNILSRRPEDARVLDIFAGTGALGLEALSRGAANVIFLEGSPEACRIITSNITRMGVEKSAAIVCHTIGEQPLPEKITQKRFNLVFMDPPYGTGLLGTALTHPDLISCLDSQGLIVAEHSIKEKLPETITGLDIHDQRKYGRTLITFFKPTGY